MNNINILNMETTQIIDFLKTLQNKTDKKCEIKLYSMFIKVLESLNGMNLSDEKMQSISEKLEQLNLDSVQEKQFKYIKKQYLDFTFFLEVKHKIVEKNRYLSLGISLGIVFGLVTTTALGIDFGLGNETTGGLIGGMLIGMAIGSVMDKKAENENRVLIKK